MKKYIIALILSILPILASLIGGIYFNWAYQFTFLIAVYYVLGLYILNLNNKVKVTISMILIIILPLVLLIAKPILFYNIKLIPLLIAPIVSIILAYISYHYVKRKISYTIIISLLCLSSFIFMSNWLNSFQNIDELVQKPFPNIIIKDSDNKLFNFPKNKIIILDIWATNCGICIKKFPEFEKLKEKYSNNDGVLFYTLNLPLRKEKEIDVSYTNRYSFTSLFAVNFDSWKKLETNTVPKILILDKNQKVRYYGSLNDKWYHFYKNINKLINNVENE